MNVLDIRSCLFHTRFSQPFKLHNKFICFQCLVALAAYCFHHVLTMVPYQETEIVHFNIRHPVFSRPDSF